MAEKLNKDAVYRAAKPKDKDYTINDGSVLALLVKPTAPSGGFLIIVLKANKIA
jgi:hypothetical protein